MGANLLGYNHLADTNINWFSIDGYRGRTGGFICCVILGRGPRYDNQSDKFYYFQYYTNEKNIGYLHPSVSILMHSSSKVVHYTDEQMVEIWDRILGSFRYKPNTF